MKTVTIGEIAKPKQWGVLAKANMLNAGYPVYGANGVIGYAAEFTHSEPTILLGCRGTIGTVHISQPRAFVTSNAMALDHLDEARVSLMYLARFLSWRGLKDVQSGSSQPQLTRGNLVNVRVPLPTMTEQIRIAAILDHADVLRAKRRQVLAHLDALTQSIFHDMFGDPVHNSEGLPLVKLRELGTLDRGVSKHRPRNEPTLLGGRHPLIQTGDVANSGGHITRFSATYSDQGLAQSRMWPAGTLCITIAANIAKTGILTFDACFPDSVVGFSSDPETTSFIRVWLSFLQSTLEASAPQSAQKNINLAILRELDVPTPSRAELVEFAARVGRVNDQRVAVERVLAADEELFGSVQSRAFKGEL